MNQQIRIERLAANQRRLINRRLLHLIDAIETLTRRTSRDPTNVVRLAAQRARLDRLMDEILPLVDTALLGKDSLYDALKETLGDTVASELNLHADLINRATGAPLMRNTITPAQIEQTIDTTVFPSPAGPGTPNVFRGEATVWLENIRDNFTRRLRSAWLGSLTEGPTLNDLLVGLRGSTAGRLGPRSVASVTSAQSQAFYRTWQSAVHNQARITMYKNNDDFIRSIRDVATFDTRTVAISIARHGNRYRIPSLEPLRRLDGRQSHAYLGGMPYHVGERNFYTPELRRVSDIEKSDRAYTKARVKELNQSQRQALDGKIPDNTTFDAFLRRQTATEQREILGTGTYNLWRDGKLTLRDLIRSTTGRQLSVTELTERYGETTASNLR